VGEFCWRALQALAPQLPPGVALLDRPMPARPLHESWSHWAFPPIELFIGRSDVVHGTNFVVPPAWRAAMVVSVHDLTPVHFPELVEPSTLAYPGLIRKALRRGAWVHTPSEFVAGEVIEVFGAPPERVRVVPHGIVPRAPRVLPGPSGPDLQGVGDLLPGLPGWVQRYVLAVGTVEPRKDLPTLVRAFAMAAQSRPGLALVIAGREGWGRAQLDDAVAACALRDRVVRLGWVDDEARDALISGATVLVYPSLYEGFGFPPLEAMAAGTPVVTTRCGALQEVLGDAARFVDVGDIDALAQALEELVDDEPARNELARRGLERARLYTWDACAAGLSALYHDAYAAR
jgi:glycosyltransferase involved in cell wall biosynthesis